MLSSLAYAEEDIYTPYTFKYLACDISTTPNAIMMGGILMASIVLAFVIVKLDVPIFIVFSGGVLAFFSWNYASCMFGMNYLITFIGLALLFHGLKRISE